MSLCEGCKNLVIAKIKEHIHLDSEEHNCLYGIKSIDVVECSHFEERPKDNSKHFDEAKQTANKGKPPRKQPYKEPKWVKDLNSL